MSKIEVKPIELDLAKDIESSALTLVSASELTISNNNQYEVATGDLMSVKGRLKALDERRKAITTPLDLAKKSIMDLFRPVVDKLESAEALIKRAIVDYTTKQEVAARQAQFRAEAEAEAKRKELLEKAEKARENGKDVKAAQYEEKAATVVAPIVISPVEKQEGIAFKEIWRATVIQEQLVPREYLTVDLTKLNRIAMATKGSLKIPGVNFYAEKVVASKAR